MDQQIIDDRPEQADQYASLKVVHGRIFVAYSRFGVSAVRPAKDAAGFEAWFRGQVGRPLQRGTAIPGDLAEAIQEHIQERDRRVSLDLRASTDFERAVLLKTQEIPRGEVRTYGWIAREIGQPGAAQEVGVALSRNPVLYLIPCHRVVRSDGSLAGYAGGGARVKREILLRESFNPTRTEDSAWTRRVL
jgi:methylated-DNA-[protein]-cysteine S-methyltransferase